MLKLTSMTGEILSELWRKHGGSLLASNNLVSDVKWHEMEQLKLFLRDAQKFN